MAHPQIAAFARLAEGAEKPTRRISGQKTLLGRTMHTIAYDPVHDEIVVPQQFAQAILTFRGGADGEEPPIRVIQGPRTQLTDLSRLDVDPVHNEIFVPLGDSILVFPRQAHGDVEPIRILKGPDTQLGASAVIVDAVNNLLIVAGSRQDAVLIFHRTDSGNAKPKAVIGGPHTGIRRPALMAVYPPKGLIFVGVRGAPPTELETEEGFVGVWSVRDNGDVPPRWTIGGPHGVLKQLRGVALDPKNKSVIVSDKRLNAVLTFYFPEAF